MQVLDSRARISDHPDSYGQLTSQPRFVDGLDHEEAALVIAVRGAVSRSLELYGYQLLWTASSSGVLLSAGNPRRSCPHSP